MWIIKGWRGEKKLICTPLNLFFFFGCVLSSGCVAAWWEDAWIVHTQTRNRKATIISTLLSSWSFLPVGGALRFQVWARSGEVKWGWVGSGEVKWGWVSLHYSYSSSRCGSKDDPLMAAETVKWRLSLIIPVWFHLTGEDEKSHTVHPKHTKLNQGKKKKKRKNLIIDAPPLKKRENKLWKAKRFLTLPSGSFNRRQNIEIQD